jgi:hypothetical protein
MQLFCLLAAVGVSAALSLHKDALQPPPHNADGKPAWVNRNDVDWESCDSSQVLQQSEILDVALEEEHGGFHDHHGVLYRCSTEANPFYLRYSNKKTLTGTTFINLQWPSVLDETYLFATTAEDKDKIQYGFRIMVSSDTKKRYHFRRFLFHTLDGINHFIKSVSTMTNDSPSLLGKADFFKAPRYAIPALSHSAPENEFGDRFLDGPKLHEDTVDVYR